MHLDDSVDAWFDRNLRGRPTVDRAFYSLSELGDFSLIWHLVGVAGGTLSRDPDQGLADAVRLSAVLGVESAVVNWGVKSLFRRERPVLHFERPHGLRVPRTTSFPSGHASAAFCAATLLSETSPLGPVWYAVAAGVAASRVHVKIHHASDVVVGAAVGLAIGRIARRVWPRR